MRKEWWAEIHKSTHIYEQAIVKPVAGFADPRKWSQKYEYDVMDRLTKAEQGNVGGTWPSSPTMTADKTWTWDSDGSPHLDKGGNWAYFDNDGTADDRSHNDVNEIITITDRSYRLKDRATQASQGTKLPRKASKNQETACEKVKR